MRDRPEPPLPWGDFIQPYRRSLLPILAIEWATEWMVYWLGSWALIDLAKLIGSLSIFWAAVSYVITAPETRENQRKARQYQAWQMINNAQGKTGSAGRIDALEDLARDGVALDHLDLSNALLDDIQLPGASLNNASFVKASLRRADLRDARMERADLMLARMGSTDLRGAVLAWANLRGANFIVAKFEGADLQVADLRGAYCGPSIKQVKTLEGERLRRATFNGHS